MVITTLFTTPSNFICWGYKIKRICLSFSHTGDKKPKVAEPSAPQDLNVSSVSSDTISITWSAPTEDGGKPIQKYVICMKEVGTKKLRKVRNHTLLRICLRLRNALLIIASILLLSHEENLAVNAVSKYTQIV